MTAQAVRPEPSSGDPGAALAIARPNYCAAERTQQVLKASFSTTSTRRRKKGILRKTRHLILANCHGPESNESNAPSIAYLHPTDAPAVPRVNPLPHQVAIHLIAGIVVIIAEGIAVRPIKTQAPATAKSSSMKSAPMESTAAVKSTSAPMGAMRERPRRQSKASRGDNEQGDDCFTRHGFSPLEVDLKLLI
jgi:hypothetical protein